MINDVSNQVIAIVFVIALFIGFLYGVFMARGSYNLDAYDCTIKCPNNSHSILFDKTCYCEVK